MKRLSLVLAGAALAASAPLGAQRPNPIVPSDCSLIVAFGSYAMGIDTAALQSVEALLDGLRGVRSVTRHPRGREGEVSLCVRTRSRADSARLFQAIRQRIPARPRGPVSIQTLEGRRFDAPRPG